MGCMYKEVKCNQIQNFVHSGLYVAALFMYIVCVCVEGQEQSD